MLLSFKMKSYMVS